jgi:hypothetical protein
MWHMKYEGEKSGEEGMMIKWLGENGGEFVGTSKYFCVQIRFLCRFCRGWFGRGSRML